MKININFKIYNKEERIHQQKMIARKKILKRTYKLVLQQPELTECFLKWAEIDIKTKDQLIDLQSKK